MGHFWVKFRLGWVITRVSLLVHSGGYESLPGWVRCGRGLWVAGGGFE